MRHAWKGGENPFTTRSKHVSSPPPLDILLPPRWLLRATKSEPTYRASRLFFLFSSRHFSLSLSPSIFSVLLPDGVTSRSFVSLSAMDPGSVSDTEPLTETALTAADVGWLETEAEDGAE